MFSTVHGDLFTQGAQAIVNPVNCVGVMGKGLALEFRQRYPGLFASYRTACESGKLLPGSYHTYQCDDGRWVVNFPTKLHWRTPSELRYIRDGLKQLDIFIVQSGITSIAFPALGCGLGMLRLEDVKPLIVAFADRNPSVDVRLVLAS